MPPPIAVDHRRQSICHAVNKTQTNGTWINKQISDVCERRDSLLFRSAAMPMHSVADPQLQSHSAKIIFEFPRADYVELNIKISQVRKCLDQQI